MRGISWKFPLGLIVTVLAVIVAGGAVYWMLRSGSCSTTGFSTQLGQVNQCPNGAGWVVAAMPVTLLIVLVAANTEVGAYGATLYFCAIGVGALAALHNRGSSGPSATFLAIFGGCFLAAGIAVTATVAWFQIRNARSGDGPIPLSTAAPLSRKIAVGLVSATVGAAGGIGALVLGAPGTTTTPVNAHQGGGSQQSPNAAPATPLPGACLGLTSKIAQDALGPSAKKLAEIRMDAAQSECSYVGNGYGEVIFTYGTWAAIKAGAPAGGTSLSGYGDENYISLGTSTATFIVRKGTNGLKIEVAAPVTPARPEHSGARDQANEALAEHVATELLATG